LGWRERVGGGGFHPEQRILSGCARYCWAMENEGQGCKGSMWGEVETEIEVVGPRVGEHKWKVRGFTPNSGY
jgi:hypothetical protein